MTLDARRSTIPSAPTARPTPWWIGSSSSRAPGGGIIAVLTRWDEYPLADRKGLVVLMRDFFQRLAQEGGPLPLPSGP
jgi:hypothetical protein